MRHSPYARVECNHLWQSEPDEVRMMQKVHLTSELTDYAGSGAARLHTAGGGRAAAQKLLSRSLGI
jgi:hypothetical protein